MVRPTVCSSRGKLYQHLGNIIVKSHLLFLGFVFRKKRTVRGPAANDHLRSVARSFLFTKIPPGAVVVSPTLGP